VTGWFNRSTFTTDDTIIAKRNGIVGTDTGYSCYILAADTLVCGVGDGTDLYTVTSVSTFTASGWHHYAFVWDQATSTSPKLYIDGADNGATRSGTIGNIGTLANANAFRLGAEADNGVPFAGSLDEAQVYDRALSPEEIANLYRLTTPTGVDTGLKGYWSFNAQDMYSTTTAYDRSGARNTGTLTSSPPKVPGKLGQALNFDGTADYVDAGSATSLDDIVNLTACAWIYPETVTAADWEVILTKGSTKWAMTIDNLLGPGLRLNFVRVFSTTAGDWYTPGNSATLNAWTHYCVAYNNSSAANNPVMYVNGISVPVTVNVTPVGTATADAADTFYAGFSVGTRFFDGTIDEVRVYSRILSAAEVKALYQ
jgi:hypothetical protein